MKPKMHKPKDPNKPVMNKVKRRMISSGVPRTEVNEFIQKAMGARNYEHMMEIAGEYVVWI